MTQRTCPNPSELHELLLGQLPDRETLALKEHLSSCELCRSRWDEMVEIQRHLQTESAAFQKNRYLGNLMDDIRSRLNTKEVSSRSRRRWIGVAAAALILTAFSLVYMLSSRQKETRALPSPFATITDVPSPHATPSMSLEIPTPPDMSLAFSMGTEALGGLRPPTPTTSFDKKKEAQ